MRFILSLCCSLVICSLTIAQPLTVEWERDFYFENDSVWQPQCSHLVENPISDDYYLIGKVWGVDTELYDSSYAWMQCASTDGDSLWSRVYDNEGWYTGATYHTSNRIVTMGQYDGPFLFDELGEPVDTFNAAYCDGWTEGTGALSVGSGGETYVAYSCYFWPPNIREDAAVTCFGPEGDSLWTVTLSPHQFNWIIQIEVISSDHILVAVGDWSDFADSIYSVSLSGEVIEQYPVSYLGRFIVEGQDTIVSLSDTSQNRTAFRKFVLGGQVLAESTLPISSPFRAKLLRTSDGYVVASRNGDIYGLSSDGDSLWTQRLQLDEITAAIQTLDGGYIFAGKVIVDLDQVHLVKTSAPSSTGFHVPISSEFCLHNSYPNPFNATTTLSFSLPREMHATVDIFDVQGRLVERLADKTYAAGEHQLSWNAQSVATGIYFAQMRTTTQRATQKLLLLK